MVRSARDDAVCDMERCSALIPLLAARWRFADGARMDAASPRAGGGGWLAACRSKGCRAKGPRLCM